MSLVQAPQLELLPPRRPRSVRRQLRSSRTTVWNFVLVRQWHLQAGLNAVAERSLFWNLAATTAPDSGFDPDTGWLETYVKPGLSFEHAGDGATVYGKVSAVASYTAARTHSTRATSGRARSRRRTWGFAANRCAGLPTTWRWARRN